MIDRKARARRPAEVRANGNAAPIQATDSAVQNGAALLSFMAQCGKRRSCLLNRDRHSGAPKANPESTRDARL
ncbi:hypothetical protein [Methylobacterium sp. Leaf456]|uniref:hypothetical protein n=1 Tax=Methylobacterium sp. Leaf456 TaxID=1736382 RepID=UPI000ACA246D|nr:hypothetical protein [Methylobacterium sp. Leaf456]